MKISAGEVWLTTAAALVVGHFLPWARHNTAALTLSGHDLAIFLNDTPNAGGFANEWFYVPVWTAALLIALNARPKSVWARALVAVLAAGIASLGLPTYDQARLFPRLAPDYQARFWLSLVVMGACVALALQSRWRAPDWLSAVVVELNLAPIYGFSLMRWPLQQLFGNPVNFGAGWWLSLAAVATSLAWFAYQALRARHTRRQSRVVS